MDISEEEFVTHVMRHLFKARGIDLSGYAQSFVMRSIKKRLGRSGASDHSGYLRLLKHSEEETNELLGVLSINVTEFFRDRGAFEGFSAQVLRPLIAAKLSEGGVLRIWSAGCATGQETYTIAICVAEEVRRLGGICTPVVGIQGTDLSSKAVAKAKSGLYSKAETKGLSEKLLNHYFEKKGDMYEVVQPLRKGVRFTVENLLEPPSGRYYDAIVCRNVMIYFSRKMHDVVTQHLFEALRNGGYLMLGRTETLMGAPRTSFDVVDLENRILRKK
jgi:chemotaxis protein methyltransferase CheR